MNLDIEFFLLSLAVWNEALPRGLIPLFAAPQPVPPKDGVSIAIRQDRHSPIPKSTNKLPKRTQNYQHIPNSTKCQC